MSPAPPNNPKQPNKSGRAKRAAIKTQPRNNPTKAAAQSAPRSKPNPETAQQKRPRETRRDQNPTLKQPNKSGRVKRAAIK
ncbi:MAG: hypothetical protein AB7S68_39320, partial [Polyangiaceae bacterium]